MTTIKEVYKKRSKNCLFCKKEYTFFPYEEETTKFCSKSCQAKYTMTGRKHKPESIEKMRLSKKGKIVSNQTREKIRKTLKEKYKKGVIKTAFLKGHTVFPLTEKGRNKISSVHKNEKNFNWKGGTMKWARQQVKIRDNYTCQICGLRDVEIMEVDHIKPIRKYKRYGFIDDINNMQTICPNCHRRKTNRELKVRNMGKSNAQRKKYV